MISDRIKSALNARKDKGPVMLERPKGKRKLDERNSEIKGYLKKGLNLTAISKLIDCNRQTLVNWLAAHEAEMKKI